MRKHPSLMSVLTITPWPTVKQGSAFVITGKLTELVSLAKRGLVKPVVSNRFKLD
jgi:hypothetical protein